MVINTVTKLMFTSLSCYLLLCTKKVVLKQSKMSAKSPLKQAKHRAMMSDCALLWVCSLTRVSMVFQITAVPIFPQDPASFGMREVFTCEICAEDCF